MKYVNLTPHDVTVFAGMVNPVMKFAPTWTVARLKYRDEKLFGFVKRKVVECTEWLPPPKDGVLYIVSNHVRVAWSERKDLVSPCTAVMRDGKIAGCEWLVSN